MRKFLWIAGVHAAVATLVVAAAGAAEPPPLSNTPQFGTIQLFNGRNFDGLQFFLDDPAADPAKTWQIRDGILHGTGTPLGYVRTRLAYADYTLHVEWRWASAQGGNSGVLLHIVNPDEVWPKSFEANMLTGRAGDFASFWDARGREEGLGRIPGRYSTGRLARTAAQSVEKPIGEWNSYDIVAAGDAITLRVNGVEVNHMTGVSPAAGMIGLQSEGAPVDFRNVTLTPLPPGKDMQTPLTPTTMQALVLGGTGAPADLKPQTLPVPQPGAGQVLVRIYAASVNPVDWRMRAPPAGAPAPLIEPRIPGRDVAGIVEKVGPGVTQFKVGDAVWGQVAPLPGLPLNGAYAPYALAPAADLAPKPRPLTYAQASGLGIATVTGVRAVQNAGVASGQRVLVTGAAGGVGSAAVQAAKARGAYVIGTASGRHAGYLKGIGVDEHVDYTVGDWAARIRDVDAVIDTVSAANATLALRAMKRGGRLVFVAGGPAAAACTTAGVECSGGALGPMNVAAPVAAGTPVAAPSAAAGGNPVVDEILRLANAGKLTIAIDASYPLDKAAAAWEDARAGGTQGKIVLIVDAANAGLK